MPRYTLFSNPGERAGGITSPWPGLPYNDERPREVYLASCARIGEALSGPGFPHLKSKQACRRRSGAFRHEIGFETESTN
ncbi:hypothetical protein [Massilia sp. ST3]|uniref:hypothetical protein n=1 Tax=Massilia sp. ST3 TaxID=2824903 RepID=UPI001B842F82|nr:hypothetical protein [Massilia sp. ST3]MBQ5947756.1 hypothetical protein [Massilia sp. ST3]